MMKHLPDRVLHPGRRRAALKHLAALPGWHERVLFICHGNVCRSPFAEVLFNERMRPLRALMDTPAAASAGFVGPDRGSPPEALAAAERLGLDLSAHRSQLITPELVHESSLIVVMTAEQGRLLAAMYRNHAYKLLVLGDLDPESIETRTIHDPWKGTAEVFDASYGRIDRCIRVLMSCLPRDVPARSA
jgi:protein-tyrosine phosphatase